MTEEGKKEGRYDIKVLKVFKDIREVTRRHVTGAKKEEGERGGETRGMGQMGRWAGGEQQNFGRRVRESQIFTNFAETKSDNGMTSQSLREQILSTIVEKSTLKQRVFDNTFAAFGELKDTLLEMASELDDALDGRLDKRVRLEYRDRGKFEAQLQIASDLLIFRMHTDVFEFDSNHIIWQNAYVQQDKTNSYCGIIDIYDFLSDSFKFNRSSDEGYLIGRIFINRERKFFVEGKRQVSMRAMDFGKEEISREALVAILETAINYAINFDLLTPPYEDNKRVTVEQFNTKLDNSKFVTGKRLGYDFNVDDI